MGRSTGALVKFTGRPRVGNPLGKSVADHPVTSHRNGKVEFSRSAGSRVNAITRETASWPDKKPSNFLPPAVPLSIQCRRFVCFRRVITQGISFYSSSVDRELRPRSAQGYAVLRGISPRVSLPIPFAATFQRKHEIMHAVLSAFRQGLRAGW